ncbi:AGAP006190-PA-like protein [Anopheles sinensis]|uniref:AGAP006190-PA-like protein n=1 Tax=Anopheles sinensis TaxID=74873 RepID=A0A084WL74_ANOSI|nr:AGAP006190-PA-like protein [Anopheles sinensis]
MIYQVSPATRRTKSFDDQAWKIHDETANLSVNISAISTTALATRTTRMDSDVESLGGAHQPRPLATGLDEVLVVSEGPSSDACGSLSRGEVRKSRSKMKSYLKRCKDVLIGGVSGGAQVGVATSTATSSGQEEVVVYHAHGGEQSQPSSTSCWYLDDQLMELRPEDNREPYSSLASARLKQELEETRLAREAISEERSDSGVPTVSVTTTVTSTTSSTMARIGEGGSGGDNVHGLSVIENSASGNIALETYGTDVEEPMMEKERLMIVALSVRLTLIKFRNGAATNPSGSRVPKTPARVSQPAFPTSPHEGPNKNRKGSTRQSPASNQRRAAFAAAFGSSYPIGRIGSDRSKSKVQKICVLRVLPVGSIAENVNETNELGCRMVWSCWLLVAGMLRRAN